MSSSDSINKNQIKDVKVKLSKIIATRAITATTLEK